MTSPGPVPQRGSGPAFFRRRGVVIALCIIVLLHVGALIATFAVQRYVTFPEPPAHAWHPQARAQNGGEEVWLTVDGDRVESWFLPASGGDAAAPLLIYSHGNGELIDMRADEFTTLRNAGVHILLVEYPGYGRSGGRPSEKSLRNALVAAYDWAVRDSRIDGTRIVGFGRSLGGGAITQLAAQRTLAALIVESSFENFEDVVMGYGVPRWLLLNHFNSRAVIEKYPGPLLLMHGTKDEIFPALNAQRLAAASERATVHLNRCGHNDCPRQWELVLGFLSANGVCRKPENAESSHVPSENTVC